MTTGARPVSTFLADLAAKTPTPGGGATACVAGALAAAQAEMVVAYSLGKKNLAEHQEMLGHAQEELHRARNMLLELADEDGAAYGRLNALQKLPDGDPGKAGLLEAAEQAALVPLSAMAVCASVYRLCGLLRGKSNAYLVSDLDIAQGLSATAALAAARNVEINLPALAPEVAARLRAQLTQVQVSLGGATLARA